MSSVVKAGDYLEYLNYVIEHYTAKLDSLEKEQTQRCSNYDNKVLNKLFGSKYEDTRKHYYETIEIDDYKTHIKVLKQEKAKALYYKETKVVVIADVLESKFWNWMASKN